MHRSFRAVTLIELIIAIVLLSTIALGFVSIEIFNQFHVITTIRRTKVQNEAALALEHMTKEISKAIGDVTSPPVEINATISGDEAIKVLIDANGNGRQDPLPTDCWIGYRFTGASGSPTTDRYQIWFYANCVGPNCNQAGSIGPEVIARNITSFTRSLTNNYVNVVVTACWVPAQIGSCGSSDNPSVNMSCHIKMPSVSTN